MFTLLHRRNCVAVAQEGAGAHDYVVALVQAFANFRIAVVDHAQHDVTLAHRAAVSDQHVGAIACLIDRAGGREQRIECAGLIDATAGYHARETSWSWSAGVGTGADGSALVWNIVNGVHDAPTSSERTVWVDGAASEQPAAEFPADLGSVVFPGHGESLSFSAEAERANSEDLKIFASEYRQPFGTFSGALPGGVELASGFGVMERHSARW